MTITNGPITRDVRDAALVMQAVAGPDGRDIGCIEEPAPNYLAELDQDLAGLRIAWTDDFGYAGMYGLDQSPAVIAAVRQAAQGFSQLGAQLETTQEVFEDFWAGYVATSQAYREGPMASPTPPTPEALQAALETRGRNWARFEALFANCDLLLSPTLQFTAFTVEGWDAAWNREGANYTHGIFAPTYTSHTHMFNWLGWPAISVPCGFVNGLPVGLQIIAPPRREALLYRAASAFLSAYPRLERPVVS
jgi:Asp-tRNA(Asn)/Glu-tRNA(Gln) amidotransferase A subunit family amidase